MKHWSTTRLLAGIVSALLLNSCSWFQGAEHLGSGYYFMEEGKNSCVILSPKYNWYTTPSIGYSIVPERVVQYGYTDRYIAAISYDKLKKQHVFWLIDKRGKSALLEAPAVDRIGSLSHKGVDSVLHQNVVGPLDSLQYQRFMENHHVAITLKKW